jgi:hypothetical protein
MDNDLLASALPLGSTPIRYNGDNDYDAHDGLTTEIPPDGVEALDTQFGFTVYAPSGRRYIPSWVSFG